MFYVVSYDIPDDRRRTEVHDTLKNYGTRVQFSVFECNLAPAQLHELRERMATLIVPTEDNLRYYYIASAGTAWSRRSSWENSP